VQESGTQNVLFCPRLDTVSKQSDVSCWCMALCGVDAKGPQTLDQFAVCTIGDDGMPTGKPDCIIKVEGSDGPLRVKVEALGDGNFYVESNYDSLLYSNDWSIKRVVDGVVTNDSPVKFHVGDIADTARCSTNAPGLEELVVYARSEDGKPTDGVCIVTIVGPNGPIEVKVQDVGDGCFHAKYNQLLPGDYEINCMVDGLHVSQFYAKSSGDNSDKCLKYSTRYSSGSGIYRSGIDASPAPFAGFHGSPPVSAARIREQFIALRAVVQKNDFEYFQLSGTEQVFFCPRIDVTSTPMDGSRWCIALCGTEESGPQIVDQFAVYAIGPDGMPANKPDYRITIKGPDGPLQVKVEPHEDGTFKVECNADSFLKSNCWSINKIIDGITIVDSPTKSQVRNIAFPERCSANEPGLEDLVVRARDAAGSLTDALCTVAITGPNGPVEVKMEEMGPGEFRAKYNALPLGDYEIHCMVDGLPVAKFCAKPSDSQRCDGSPDKCLKYSTIYSSGRGIYVSGGGYDIVSSNGQNKCFIDGPKLENLTVYVRDTGGRPVKNCLCLVEIEGPNGPVNVQVDDTGDASFHATYKPLNLVPGEYKMKILVGSLPIAQYCITTVAGSAELLLKKGADSKQCFVEGPGLEELTVHLRDYCGMPTNGCCVVEIKGPQGPVKVRVDNSSFGTFKAAFNPMNLVPGDYEVNVLVDSQFIARYCIRTIAGSGKLNVRMMPDIRQCVINGLGEEELFVYLRDYNGRPCDGACAVEIEGPNGPVETKSEFLDLGNVRASYRRLNSEIGKYLITILVDSHCVAKFRVNVVEMLAKLDISSLVDAKQCFVSRPGMEQLMIYLRGYDGKPVTGHCSVEIEGPNGSLEAEISDMGSGIFRAKYSPLDKVVGNYIINVLVDYQIIAKYPLCIRNRVSETKCYIKGPSISDVTVRLEDENGNPVDGIVVVEMKGPNGKVEVKYEEVDNSHIAKYTPLNLLPGDYFINVFVNSRCVSEFRVTSSKTSIAAVHRTR